MRNEGLSAAQRTQLEQKFGPKLQRDVPLAPFTSARIGGQADFLLELTTASELEHAALALWHAGLPFRVLGGGSNVLIADEGVREVILLNKARARRFFEDESGLHIWAESGAMLGTLSRLAAERGWGGFEWAATVPGTLGGAVVGNAGAHGSDMSDNLTLADILQQEGRVVHWSAAELDFRYRSSRLKRESGRYIVLAAELKAEPSTPQACKERMTEFARHRSKTQPAGASMGSMFKNPPDDYAGRLIEKAGLKGQKEGAVQISELHANFFVNHGDGKAQDVWKLIDRARREVKQQFGVLLELEIELLGAWKINAAAGV